MPDWDFLNALSLAGWKRRIEPAGLSVIIVHLRPMPRGLVDFSIDQHPFDIVGITNNRVRSGNLLVNSPEKEAVLAEALVMISSP